MRIGVVVHPYSEKAPAGLGRIIADLATNLVLYAPESVEFVFFYKHETSADLPTIRPVIHRYLGGGRLWLEQIRKDIPCDWYIFNTPVLPLLPLAGKSLVLSLDYAYLMANISPDLSFFSRAVIYLRHAWGLLRADKVVAISEATQIDTLRFFPYVKHKIRTMYFGFHPMCKADTEKANQYGEYVLFVGALKHRKNVHGAIAGFISFVQAHPESTLRLLVAGSGKGAYVENLHTLAAPFASRIQFLGFVPDQELPPLYKGAKALLFPSLLEGFGYPVLEAFQCGVPVITSRTSSLGEIAGSSALLVDPENSLEIAEAINQVLDQEISDQLVSSGSKRALDFRWDVGVKELLEYMGI